MNTIEMAKQFAISKHGRQSYSRNSYIYHLDSVVELAKNMGESDFVLIVAYLHDTREDTDTTDEEIRQLFGDKIADAVAVITKLANETYPEYIHRVSKHEISKRVKVLDLICNLRETIIMENCERKERLMNKYQTALYFLATQQTTQEK